MSDNIKLIIEIPNKMYHKIIGGIYDYGDMNIIIQNGIPLDDVKAEIKEKLDKINYIVSDLPYPKHRAIQELLSDIMEIIKGVENGPQEIQ